MKDDLNLNCQLCPTDRFEPYRVEGRDTGLLVCCGCRLVYAPRGPAAPRLQGVQTPVSPNLKNWGAG